MKVLHCGGKGYLVALCAAFLGILTLLGSGPILSSSRDVRDVPDDVDQYVDPSACGVPDCHPDRVKNFFSSGLSAGRIEQLPQPEDWTDNNSYYHELSNRYYVVFKRDGAFFQQRYQLNPQGGTINVVEKQIHYVIGTGFHARTYVHKTDDGRLIQLPLGWYSENGGYWAMSPGYDRPDHFGFRREITDECIFCHSAYPFGDEPLAPIDCQRCHGPGRRHVEEATSGKQTRGNLLNLKKAPPSRQLEVCMQCHLETTSRLLPNSIKRYDRKVYSYRAGDPLADYKLFFDHRKGVGFEDKFEANNAVYRFFQSKCFLNSSGTLTCLTCHHPNHLVRSETLTRHYQEACESCHMPAVARMVVTGGHPAQLESCVTCHMPKRRAENAAHQVRTDHAILPRPPSGDLLAPIDELEVAKKRQYAGRVELYYPVELPRESDRLYFAVAQVRDGSNLFEGIEMLEHAIREFKPKEAGFYFDLGEAYRKTGDLKKARKYFEEALERDDRSAAAYYALAEVHLREKRPERATSTLKRALEMGCVESRIYTTLGIAEGQRGDADQALANLEKAVRVNPDDPLAWLNLGASLEAVGRGSGAIGAYKTAIRLQPDFAYAHFYLANLLVALNRPDQASFHYTEAAKLDSSFEERVKGILETLSIR